LDRILVPSPVVFEYPGDLFREALRNVVATEVIRRMGVKKEMIPVYNDNAPSKWVERGLRTDPGLATFDIHGDPLQKGDARVPLRNNAVVNDITLAKSVRLIQDMQRENVRFVALFNQRIHQLKERGRLRVSVNGRDQDVLTMDQLVQVCSSILGKDLFTEFNRYGFRVDKRKARFSRSVADLKKLEPVAGKPALEKSKLSTFVLKKGEKKAKDVVLELVGCPAGTAQMGCRGDSNGPLWSHQIAITEPFWIGKTQVTKRQWAAVMPDRKRSPKEFELAKALGGENSAADHLSYADVLAFCAKLTEQYRYKIPLGYSFRPPTEAEWEYACNAGSVDGPYLAAGRLTMAEEKGFCWTKIDSKDLLERKRVKLPKNFDRAQLPMGPVAQRKPNAWGLHDMLGNGWEWCLDTFAPPAEGKNAADARTQEHLRKIFVYKPTMADPLFAYEGPDAYACARGMDYAGEDACTKTVFPVSGEPSAEMTFRVCLGPDLGQRP